MTTFTNRQFCAVAAGNESRFSEKTSAFGRQNGNRQNHSGCVLSQVLHNVATTPKHRGGQRTMEAVYETAIALRCLGV